MAVVNLYRCLPSVFMRFTIFPSVYKSQILGQNTTVDRLQAETVTRYNSFVGGTCFLVSQPGIFSLQPGIPYFQELLKTSVSGLPSAVAVKSLISFQMHKSIFKLHYDSPAQHMHI